MFVSLDLLRWLANATALGRVYGPYDRSKTTPHPSVNWTLVSTEDNLKLVDLLEQCQPRGRKLLEFLVWREAVLERSRGRRWSSDRVTLARDRLLALRRWVGDLT
jgi:hypothetical protein